MHTHGSHIYGDSFTVFLLCWAEHVVFLTETLSHMWHSPDFIVILAGGDLCLYILLKSGLNSAVLARVWASWSPPEQHSEKWVGVLMTDA